MRNRTILRRSAGVVFMAAVITLLSGCAVSPPKTVEQVLLERSSAKWAAIFAMDYKTAYEHLSPGYRKTFSLQNYSRRISNQPVKWLAATPQGVSCDERVCEVAVRLRSEVRPKVLLVKPVEVESVIYENWIKAKDGQWYYVPKQ